ncbi:MAG: hypothetical protein MUQ14_11415, partial [Burkholderiaceae bacterium]|nr:hypothetical protein [Burkholderiaceae bacterium]
FNPSPVDAALTYATPAPQAPADVSASLRNNPNVDAAQTVTIGASQPFAMLTSIAAGTGDAVVYLDDLQAGQQVQVLTREGVHVLGGPLPIEAQDMILREDYGFQSAARYDTRYLNQPKELAYRQADLFLGAKAMPTTAQVFDEAGGVMDGVPVAARLETARISNNLVGDTRGQVVAAGALEINGQALGALVTKSGPLQATDIAAWLNAANMPGVSAAAVNEIVIPASQLQLTRNLTLKGDSGTLDTITAPTGGFASASALVSAINEKRFTTGVEAGVAADGSVVLKNLEQFAGEHITIGPADLSGKSDNALGLRAGAVSGQVVMTRTLADPVNQEIRISVGTAGSALDLQTIGLRMGVYIADQSSDEYMVMVQGEGVLKAAARYTTSTLDLKQALRAEPFDVTFLANDRYTITDKSTGSVLSTRSFDASVLPAEISYRG